jgi:hypothetical protein
MSGITDCVPRTAPCGGTRFADADTRILARGGAAASCRAPAILLYA